MTTPDARAVGNVHAEFRAFWHPVAWSYEVDAAPMAVTLIRERLVVVRNSDGRVDAFLDECPHRGAPLSLGKFEDDELVCAFHGWRFGSDGLATCIPALGPDATIPSRACLRKPSQVCERYGIVWIALESPRVPIPEWPDDVDERLGRFEPVAHTSRVLAAYQTDNLLDAVTSHLHLAAVQPFDRRREVVDRHPSGFSTVQKAGR
jgi:phenylpropionate dioxygenase-like ring-hydroxylating dioxygenase large terminal subunit